MGFLQGLHEALITFPNPFKRLPDRLLLVFAIFIQNCSKLESVPCVMQSLTTTKPNLSPIETSQANPKLITKQIGHEPPWNMN